MNALLLSLWLIVSPVPPKWPSSPRYWFFAIPAERRVA